MDWIVFIVLVLGAAASGAVFKPDAWYAGLDKPGWTPPDFVFPLVWGVLYVMIAWAGVLVWRSDAHHLALAMWGAQWVFNAGWSWLFFGRRRMDWAFVDVCLLWLSVLGFMLSAWPLSPLASLLFSPYLVWVTIAAALNRTVWKMNPGEGQGAGPSAA
jgi:tryptophan-rich sensory protein